MVFKNPTTRRAALQSVVDLGLGVRGKAEDGSPMTSSYSY